MSKKTTTSGMTMAERMQMIEENYAIFAKALPSLLGGNEGKWVLIAEERVIPDIFDTRHDAKILGNQTYGAENYTVQQIKRDLTLSLGALSFLPSSY